jgi:hypothetical protein
LDEKRAVKWTENLSPESSVMLVLNAGKELMCDSSLRLSFVSCVQLLPT